jgi:hypothetical protein
MTGAGTPMARTATPIIIEKSPPTVTSRGSGIRWGSVFIAIIIFVILILILVIAAFKSKKAKEKRMKQDDKLLFKETQTQRKNRQKTDGKDNNFTIFGAGSSKGGGTGTKNG